MSLLLAPAPYTHADTSVAWVMRQVLYALIPGTVLYIALFGWGTVWHLLLACTTALLVESGVLWLRERPLRPTLTDGSALVTAWLLVLAIPPVAPWWVTVVGTGFAMIFAKHLYGGLGYNSFNPAMVGFAVLLIAFPREMTHWPLPASLSGYYLGPLDSFSLVFYRHNLTGQGIDALSGATVLDHLKTQLGLAFTLSEIRQISLFGRFGAKGWELISLLYLLGGLWLIYRRVIGWQIPVMMLGSLALLATVFNIVDADKYPSALFHLTSGAAFLCAFFIATDPVTAATSRRGKLVYGAGIGVLLFVIRTWGSYPDGVAFSILLMNMAAPMIDYYTRPPFFGTENLGSASERQRN